MPTEEEVRIIHSEPRSKPVTMKISEFKENFSGYVILPKNSMKGKKRNEVGIGFSAHFEKVSGSIYK